MMTKIAGNGAHDRGEAGRSQDRVDLAGSLA
jgi:hypothetical protein